VGGDLDGVIAKCSLERRGVVISNIIYSKGTPLDGGGVVQIVSKTIEQ
jgi:hypothetical protein